MKKNNMAQAGYVAIIGQPNVGKSTLLNKILGKKISITSRKPQTTRHKILGIKTVDNIQTIFVDTPGLHRGETHAINRYMNRMARQALHDVDVIVFMVDARQWTLADDWILTHFKDKNIPVILVINKVDRLARRDSLLLYLEQAKVKYPFSVMIPLCAKTGDQVAQLETCIAQYLPASPHFFPPEQSTDRDDRFISAEFVREKLMRLLGHELPYSLTVTLEAFEWDGNIWKIAAIIWIEKASQKPIVIGKSGAKLKAVGQQARLDLERHLDAKVFLKLWVKVKSGWMDDDKVLLAFGYQ